jgi:hypothetical protein
VIFAIPRESMSTFAPPARASRTRARMSASGSRKTGEVMPWSSAQMSDVPLSSATTRFMRMVLPTLLMRPPAA